MTFKKLCDHVNLLECYSNSITAIINVSFKMDLNNNLNIKIIHKKSWPVASTVPTKSLETELQKLFNSMLL